MSNNKVYVLRSDTQKAQYVPIPDDLENWYELEHDGSSLIGKQYDVENNVWIDKVEPTGSKIKRFRLAISNHIDNEATKLGYDSILTAVTYADEPAGTLDQTYGSALRAWRSICWDIARSELAKFVETGIEPTVDELIDTLPVFTPPTV